MRVQVPSSALIRNKELSKNSFPMWEAIFGYAGNFKGLIPDQCQLNAGKESVRMERVMEALKNIVGIPAGVIFLSYILISIRGKTFGMKYTKKEKKVFSVLMSVITYIYIIFTGGL